MSRLARAATRRGASDARAPHAPAKRVLVVDDEPDIQDFVSMVLRGAAYAVDTASDGREALQKIESDPPDLVILDLMMPAMDGWAVLERLSREGKPAPPVVVLSGHKDYERAREAGAAACVPKPFDVPQLLIACDRALVLGLAK